MTTVPLISRGMALKAWRDSAAVSGSVFALIASWSRATCSAATASRELAMGEVGCDQHHAEAEENRGEKIGERRGVEIRNRDSVPRHRVERDVGGVEDRHHRQRDPHHLPADGPRRDAADEHETERWPRR